MDTKDILGLQDGETHLETVGTPFMGNMETTEKPT